MKQMFIMRGLPGAGKSTLAKSLATTHDWCTAMVASADDYHIQPDGTYLWCPNKAQEAHAWCRGLAEGFCRAACHGDVLVIDNTHIKVEHFAPYLAIAAKTGFDVEVVEPDTPWQWDVDACASKTAHGVPVEVIARMKSQYETHAYA